MGNKNKDFITEIEKGKYKGKSLLYQIRGIEILNTVISYGGALLLPFINYSGMNGNATHVMLGMAALLSRQPIINGLDNLKAKMLKIFFKKRDDYTIEKQIELLEKSKGIITEDVVLENGKAKRQITLPKSQIYNKLDKYITSYNNKVTNIFSNYCNAVASIFSIGSVCYTAYLTGGNSLMTFVALGVGIPLGVCSTIYYTKKQDKIIEKYNKVDPKLASIKHEIIEKDSITKKDSVFNINRMKKINREFIEYREEKKRVNYSKFFAKSILLGSLTGIMMYCNIGDIKNLNSPILLAMLGNFYFYLEMVSKISAGLETYDRYVNLKQEYTKNLEIVKDIVKQVELKKDALKRTDKEFSKLEIKDFKGVFYERKGENNEGYKECLINIPSLSVKNGETILITGESGSGKTTILKMLKDGDINNSGSIVIDDQYLIDCLDKRALMYMPKLQLSNQEDVLSEITCGKSIETLTVEEKERLLTICRGLNLDKKEDNDIFRKKDILRELEQKTFSDFSEGQKQRLVLAKILYLMDNEHQVMIFDEPTANLDEITSEQVFKFIIDFCNRDKERMIMITSHNTSIAQRYADKVYEISNGVLKEKYKKEQYKQEVRENEDNKKEVKSTPQNSRCISLEMEDEER